MLCCIGDLCDDIVVWPDGVLARGADTAARIEHRRGGSAANVAYFAACVGQPARFVGQVGDDLTGARLCTEMDGVDLTVVRRGRTGSIIVLVDPDGERTMITDRGAALDLAPMETAWLDGVTWLHVPFYSLQAQPLASTARDLMEIARGRGIVVSVDASSASLCQGFEVDNIDVLFVNRDEAEVCHWPAPLRIVKGNPAMLVTAEQTVAVPVPEVVVPLDTTGAGDAFAAGFIASQMRGSSLVAAAEAGHLLAARVLRSPGATLA